MINNNSLTTQTNFQFGSSELEGIWWNCTTIEIPGIQLSPPKINGRAGATVNLASDTAEYSDISVTILLDREWKVFDELYQYFINRLNVETGQFKKDGRFDLWIEVYNGEGNKVKKFWFYNCRVTLFGELALDTQDSEDGNHVVTLAFLYDYFDYESELAKSFGIESVQPNAY